MNLISEEIIGVLADCTLGIIAYEDAGGLIPESLLKDAALARQFIEYALDSDNETLMNAALAWHFLYDKHCSMIDLLGRLLLSEKHEQHQEVLMYCSCPEFAELTPYLDQMLSTEFKGNLKDAAYPLWIYWALVRINTSEAENVLKKHNMLETE
jgi:hypothetical protein